MIYIKSGETLQAMLEMSGSDEGVCTIKLEYSVDGGAIWTVQRDKTDALMTYTGTGASPLTTLIVLDWLKNESPEGRLYRWRVTSFTAGSAAIPWYLKRVIPASVQLDAKTCIIVNDEAPESGADGDGVQFAGLGSLYIDTSSGVLYKNAVSATMTSWVSIG